MERVWKWMERAAALSSLLGLPGLIALTRDYAPSLPELRWLTWPWRNVSLAFLVVGILGLLVSFRPRGPIDLSRLQHSTRVKTERARLRRQIADLRALRADGAELRSAYRKREPVNRGSIGLATPMESISYDGFEFDGWSGRVLTILKQIRVSEFEGYFQQCVETREAVARMTCYQERLNWIIRRLQWLLVKMHVRRI